MVNCEIFLKGIKQHVSSDVVMLPVGFIYHKIINYFKITSCYDLVVVASFVYCPASQE